MHPARPVILAVALLLPNLAQAHVGIGDTTGFAHGALHPLSGLDHVLAMVAVGLLAARIGGRALWLVPLSFVSLMVVGGLLGAAGLPLPLVETGIALSLVVFGLALALPARLPVLATAALVGFFALFHGHAHGAEMPETASGLAYGLGFVAATAALHAAGIGLGLLLGRLGPVGGVRVARFAGVATALAGLALLGGMI